MELTRSIVLFASNILWRATGVRSAGRHLVHTLGSRDEDLRTIAGMFLVQAGSKAEPLLREALDARESLPLVLTILGDIAEPGFEPELSRFSQDSDPEVAQAAQYALAALASRRRQTD